MFADLFYILAGKSSKKWLNLLTIQFNLSFSGQTSSVFQILIKWKQTKKKKEKGDDSRYDRPRFTLVQGRNFY